MPTTQSLAAADSTESYPASQNGRPVDDDQCSLLRARLLERRDRHPAKLVFGDAARRGSAYRWGVATALGGACDDEWQLLSRLACDERGGKRLRDADLGAIATRVLDELDSASPIEPLDAARAVVWCSAMPALGELLEPAVWWRVLSGLQQFRESVVQGDRVDAPTYLLLAAEMGLTMAWRLKDLPSCKRLEKSAADSLSAWCKHDGDAIAAAVESGTHARLVLASLIRCHKILERTTKRKFKKQQLGVADELATWVAAMTTHTGVSAFSKASRKEIADDLPPHGLLGQLVDYDRETLEPSVNAALGAIQTGGRLAWEVCLPEAYHCDEDARFAVMFPDWDVRRGRVHLDFSKEDCRLELFAGKATVIAGRYETLIEVDGDPQHPIGDWTIACEYTDDDVHYLELEQPWTADLLLGRQVLLLREDRCLLLADSVIPNHESAAAATDRQIRYDGRLPLAETIATEAEPETRELFLCDSSRRGLVMPLAASEWRVGPTDATLKATPDHHLSLAGEGNGRLYLPLWFDFQQRRFRRKRTWRQLTVAEELRIARRDEAVGYRVQVGSEQWLVYRSLAESGPRSVLSKHLVADFFCARFDTGDGALEELVTVDNQDDDLNDD